IPFSLVDDISDFLSVYCSKDKYAENSEDGLYGVYTLYFDSPDYLFLRKRLEGAENRFNMRIRTYNIDSGMPCFFEIKQKQNRIVRKYRAVVHDPMWAKALETSLYPLEGFQSEKDALNADLFIRLLCSYQAAPKVLTHYRRKAFISEVDDYARVTFDIKLRCQSEEQFNLIPDETQMRAYDNETIFDPDCCVILELKCYSTQVPLWMLDLIRCFDLKQRAFSKYAASIHQVFGNVRYDMGDRMPGSTSASVGWM
ncbi:MAG: polyphosphate polymerase domain-containing protein, partial [Desulfobacterales bacterium]|nr:polyphosphate polymerase domain-containing protein [Desulfobacterales bacterium]